MLAAVDPRDRLAARFTPLSPALRRAWEAEPRRDDIAPHALFMLLAREVQRLLRAGEHADLPAIFAEVERTLAGGPGDAADAARTCLLEDLADASPDAYVHVLPWLGPRSLAFLRAWQAGPRDPFLAPAEADARLLAPLGAACPAFARGWPRAAPHVSAADGTTTLHGIADFSFEVARALADRGQHDDLAALLTAIDPRLAPTDRALARAFERCFLARLRELTLARLDPFLPRLGPRARAYWAARLRLGEPRFGAWDEDGDVRLLPATTLRREAAWGWTVAMPRGDARSRLHESLLRAGSVVAEDDTTIDDDGDARARWTWNDCDPPGDYALELRLGDRPLARFAFTLL